MKTREALAAYLEAEKLGGRDAKIFRKIAREYALAMPDTPAKANSGNWASRRSRTRRRAVAADPREPDAHLALAICYGRLAPFLDNKTKIGLFQAREGTREKSIALDATMITPTTCSARGITRWPA